MTTFLERLAEVIAKKRTKTGEKRDQAAMRRRFQEEAVEKDKRKEADKKYQAKKKAEEEKALKKEKTTETTDTQKKNELALVEKKSAPKQKESKIENAVSKLKAMKKPSLFMINANVTATNDTKEEGAKQFAAFMDDDGEDLLAKPKDVLSNKCIYLSSKGGIHAWICPEADSNFLHEASFAHSLEHFPSPSHIAGEKAPKSTIDLKSPNPFKGLKLELLHGVGNVNDLTNTLQAAWSPIAEALAKETEEKKKKPEEEKEEAPPSDEPEDEEDAEITDDELEADIIDAVNKSEDSTLAEVWVANHVTIYLLYERNRKAYSRIVKAFSKKLAGMIQKEKSPDVEKTTREVLKDFCAAAGITREADKKEFEDNVKEAMKGEDEEEDKDVNVTPASGVNIGKLRSMRNPHMFILDPSKKPAQYADFLGPDAAGETPKASNVLPDAVKFLVSSQIKIDNKPLIVYILNEKQTDTLKVELKRREASQPYYLLGPIDKKVFEAEEPFTGMILKDSEGREVKLDKRLTDEMNRVLMDASSETSGNPMPAVQANSYVPVNFFRLLNPKQRQVNLYLGGRPEGVGYENTIYVLTESEAEADRFVNMMRKFKMPSLFYERMSSNSDVDVGFKTSDPEVLKPANVLILQAKTKFNPKEKIAVTEDNVSILPDGTKIGTEIEQLKFLHGVASAVLGNIAKNSGAWVKGRYTIGTLVAQFNADMTYCFLWGSHTQHVSVKEKELLEKMPFVKKVITSYL
jgi:hypothetical protein